MHAGVRCSAQRSDGGCAIAAKRVYSRHFPEQLIGRFARRLTPAQSSECLIKYLCCGQ
jgi:hypothetical protein